MAAKEPTKPDLVCTAAKQIGQSRSGLLRKPNQGWGSYIRLSTCFSLKETIWHQGGRFFPQERRHSSSKDALRSATTQIFSSSSIRTSVQIISSPTKTNSTGRNNRMRCFTPNMAWFTTPIILVRSAAGGYSWGSRGHIAGSRQHEQRIYEQNQREQDRLRRQIWFVWKGFLYTLSIDHQKKNKKKTGLQEIVLSQERGVLTLLLAFHYRLRNFFPYC